MNSKVQCPYGQDHRVEIVRLIYENGVSRGHIAGEYSFSITPLAKKLNPPLEPTKGILYGFGKFLVGLAVIGILFQLIFPSGREPTVLARNLPYCVAPLIVGIVLMIVRWSQYRSQSKKWVSRRQLWEKLYYCFEHDIVFIPQSDYWVPAESLRKRMGLSS